MHFAASVPDINDIVDILYEQPESIKQGGKRENLSPGHLAVLAKEPHMDLIERLKEYDPNFGRSVTSHIVAKTKKSTTYLHLAAQYSNSVEVISELIRICPEVLEMRDSSRCTPLLRCLTNQTSAAPDILQAIVDAAPQTASMEHPVTGEMPLHLLVGGLNKVPETSKVRMIHLLLRAFPEAMIIPDQYGMLPIRAAARSAKLAVLKALVEANPGYELLDFDVAVEAASEEKWDNLTYIHSIKPELFMTVYTGYPLLHHAMYDFLPRKEEDFLSMQAILSLSPDAARLLKENGNNLLHAFMYGCSSRLNIVPAAWDTLIEVTSAPHPRGSHRYQRIWRDTLRPVGSWQ